MIQTDNQSQTVNKYRKHKICVSNLMIWEIDSATRK